MVEVARIMTFCTRNKRDIVKRLMATSKFYKNISFYEAMQQFRYSERKGLVVYGDGWLAVYHDCDNI